MKNFLVGIVLILHCSQVTAEDWPQWRGNNRDGKWNEPNALKKFETEKLKPKWTAKISSGYTGPTVANGKVFVMDRKVEPVQTERILCLDASNGDHHWTIEYPCKYIAVGYTAGPRASVSVDNGKAYALGAMGNLHCVDVASGEITWKRDLNTEYKILASTKSENRMPIWGISASPLIYQDLLILHIGGRDGACVVALDKNSGKEKWRALDDRAQYSSPILVKQGGKDVVVVWTGDSVSGIDAKSGKVYWSEPMVPTRMPIGIATPIVQNDHVFVTSFYDGSMMLNLNHAEMSATRVWRKIGRDEKNTEGLHSIISTPIWLKDHIYGVDSYGEFRCLEAQTGKRIWENLTATPKARWSTIHFVQNKDRVWMLNERGELIISKLGPEGYSEISRAELLKPTLEQLRRRNGVCWSHPAFANGYVYARNDNELVCAKVTE